VTTIAAPAEPTLDISAMAEQSGISATALRWYEQTGLLLTPPLRTSGGQRRYDQDHVRWVHMLTCLRGTGMPIAAMRQYAALCRAGEGNEAERLALLEGHRAVARARLDQAQRDLDAIEAKVATYRRKIHP
jgi:DNA-binding transcriptional MerR regulator